MFSEKDMPRILDCKKFVLHEENSLTSRRKRIVKHYELDYNISGTRRITVDDKEYIAEAGSLIFRRPGQSCASVGDYNMYMLTFDWTDDDIKTTEHFRNYSIVYKTEETGTPKIELPTLFVPSHASEILQIYERLALIFQQPARESVGRLQLAKLLHLSLADALEKELEQVEKYTPVDKIISYIDAHYMENITLESIAEHVHLSRHYLVHYFRSKTGRTPLDFVLTTRLERAKSLLAYSDLSVVDIATRCGFESSSYFCRRFKNAFGITPLSYRETKNSNKGE